MLSYLLLVFSVVVALQCLYYLIFVSLTFSKKQEKKEFSQPVSVLICAKNEADNLQKFLPNILEQKYKGTLEVVLINDRSTDNTLEVMHDFSEKDARIKIVNVQDNENFWGNKKYALTLGIKAASHEHLIFTDADCKPVSKNWIQELSASFSKQKSIVLGYGAYEKVKHSFLNSIIRYETLLTAIQYLSFAKIGMPYMGVGRNLAYTKSEFFKVNGFIKHIQIKSGDDDLFINEVANRKNTTCSLNRQSFTRSEPKKTFKEWIQQKRRHISTAKHYKWRHKITLALFYCSQLLFFILASWLLFENQQLHTVLLLIGIRYFVFLTTIGVGAFKLNEKDLLLTAPFTEITLIFIQLYLFIKNKFSKPTHW